SLPLIGLFAPFYLIPRPLFDRAFSMVEICTVLALVAVVLRSLPAILNWISASLKASASLAGQPAWRWPRDRILLLDVAVLFFVIAAGFSVVTAELRGVALREFRVIVLEPALFYLLIRLILTNHPAPKPIIWMIADFLVLGGVIVSLIGLNDLITGQNLITAE